MRIKAIIYTVNFLAAAVICSTAISCVSLKGISSYFPIRVLEGTVQMHISLLPLKSYSSPMRGENKYEKQLREYQKSFIPNSIPQQERNILSPHFPYDPRNEQNANKQNMSVERNKPEYFVKYIAQGNELQWHIPRDYRIKIVITNPYTETAVCECSNQQFKLKKGEKKVLHFYH